MENAKVPTPSGDISQLAEHPFRHESGRLVSLLGRVFGVDRLQWAEDIVQEARVRALKTWPYYGIPKNPAAWLTQTAKNLALDLQTLYLLFNEGYKASNGERLIKEELCQEAIRLATLLARHPVGNQARTHALAALMCLNAARLPARVDSDGNILRLKDQDRSRWNQTLLGNGLKHFALSATGQELSAYHLQAGIAACHSTAPNYLSTNWPRIPSLYERWRELDNSLIISLNRAVAVAQVHGPHCKCL